MTIIESPQPGVARKVDAGIIDCDIHPLPKTAKSLHPYLPKRWQEHAEQFGGHLRQPFINTTQYPRSAPLICRRDAWPPSGGPPGSDLDFMREQHLDPFNVINGILIRCSVMSAVNAISATPKRSPLRTTTGRWRSGSTRSRGCAERWWCRRTILSAAVKEIERCARDQRFLQIMLAPRSSEPLGRQRCWPIYEAAETYNLPLGIPLLRCRRSRLDRRRLAVVLHGRALRHHHGRACDHEQPRARRRARTFPEAARRADRNRLCVGAELPLAHGSFCGNGCAAKSRIWCIRHRTM